MILVKASHIPNILQIIFEWKILRKYFNTRYRLKCPKKAHCESDYGDQKIGVPGSWSLDISLFEVWWAYLLVEFLNLYIKCMENSFER